MAKSGNQGIQSSKLVRPGVRTGAAREGFNAGYAGQIGAALGSHASDSGKVLTKAPVPMRTAAPVAAAAKLGNEVAKNVGAGGPGTGRTVMATGSQGQHGPAAGSARPGGDPFGGR
jgi:hypothetical protein